MRFLSYNVKSALLGGIDGLSDAISPLAADVVGLQEVDRGTQRAGGRDQAAELAARLGLDHAVFAAAVPWAGGGEYGVALLSRHPLSDIATQPLPVPTDPSVQEGLREPRVLLSATLRPTGGTPLRVFVTHFGLSPEQRAMQAREVASAVQQAAGSGPVVLLGDLNAEPDAAELAPLRRNLRDAHAELAPEQRTTFPAGAGPGEGVVVDYVLVSSEVEVRAARIVRSADPASDHDACFAELAF